jgi:hypothetical protein
MYFLFFAFCGILIVQIKIQEAVLKKNAVLYHLLGLFLAPIVLVCAFAAISAFATRKYEYMPGELDFIKDMFFYLASWLLDFSVFFCVGAFCYALYDRKVLSASVCAVITLFHAFLMPMIVFLVRSVFLADVCSSREMEQYWENDVLTSQANTATALTSMLVVLTVAVIYIVKRRRSAFEKPYVIPKSEPSVAALTVCAVYLIFTTFTFTFGGEYNFISLGMQILFIVIEYFVMILGAYCQKNALKNPEPAENM